MSRSTGKLDSPRRSRGARSLLGRTAAIVVALLAVGAAVGSPALGVPGSPGVPQAGATDVFFENFQNQTATNGIRIGQYTGGPAANNSTYVTSPNWAPTGNQCNGWILRSSTPRNATVTTVDSGCDATAWSFLQGMGTAIGLYRGEALATAQTNQILSAYTNGGSNPGPGVQVQTAQPITAGIIPGHFYLISAIYGAANCVSEGPTLNRQDPSLTFNLIQNQTGSGPAPGTGGGTVTPLATGLNPCTDANARVITTAGHTYHIARLNSAGFRMPSGVTSLGIQLYNAAGSYRGNDSGFDDPTIVDATPQLDKVFSPSTLQAGQSTTLTFTITNTDELSAKNGWSFTDTLPAGLAFSGPASTDCPAGVPTIDGTTISGTGNLTAGLASCTFTVPVTSATPGTFTNGPDNIGPIDGLLEPGDSTVVFTQPDLPGISLIKSTDVTDPAQYTVGRLVTYSFDVTNTGNVPLTAVDVTETSFSGAGTPPTITCPTTTLAVGAATTCTATYTIVQADVDVGSVTNAALASGTPPSGPAVTDTSSAVISGSEAPALNLVKTADASGVSAPAAVGDPVAYTITVTNTGNVTLEGVGVDDTLLGGDITLTWPGVAGTLAPGESVVATGTHAVTQTEIDAGHVTNTATATGSTAGGTDVTAGPQSTDTPLTPGPHLSITKAATPSFSTPPAVGDPIIFDFTITNDGNLTLHGVVLTDRLPGLSPPVYTWPGAAGVLAPGDTATATATYAITQADIDAGGVLNTAFATGTTPAGAETPSEPADTSTPITRAPAIALTKTADASGVQNPTRPGDPVVYLFAVTNTGNTTLTGVRITDSLAGLGPLTFVWPGADGVLEPGQQARATATYAVTGADIDAGEVVNSAVASGTASDESTVESPPAGTTTPLGAVANLSLVKSVSPNGPAQFVAGQLLTYSFVVTNTGNVPVGGVSIQETAFSGTGTMSTATCPGTVLQPGDQVTCTATYTLTQADIDAGRVTNTAIATGTTRDDVAVPSNESDAVVPAEPAPAVTLVKTADVTQVTEAGQTVTYSYVVTNVGNVTLGAPTVAETIFTGAGTAPTPACPPETTSLAPGASVTCTASYVVVAADLTGEPIANTATASASAPGQQTVTSPPASASVDTVVPGPPTPTPTPTPVPPPPGPSGEGSSPLAGTGSTISIAAIAVAGLLIISGAIVLLTRRRRRPGAR
ncbi:LPXTG cell wall anchor domain-containing protein [Leifsonia sp. NPDC080035]|uniref:LPXTG cell wall anchor domain-containing protein n=1 Tax=Leifsonia sp. NPDC080035 TaxID=3143936 RepID=A0AAU7GAP8_9MICO